MTIIFIDTNILGQIISPVNKNSKERLEKILARGGLVFSSDICEYEIKRNLILTQLDKSNSEKLKTLSQKSLENLDNLRKESYIEFLVVDYVVLTKATVSLWEEIRF